MKKTIKIVKVCSFAVCGLATIDNCLCMRDEAPLLSTQYVKEQMMKERNQEITKELSEYAKNEEVNMLREIKSIKRKGDIVTREYQIDLMKRNAVLDNQLLIDGNIKYDPLIVKACNERVEGHIKLKQQEYQKKNDAYREFLENKYREQSLKDFEDTKAEVEKKFLEKKNEGFQKIQEEIDMMPRTNTQQVLFKCVKMSYADAKIMCDFNLEFAKEIKVEHEEVKELHNLSLLK